MRGFRATGTRSSVGLISAVSRAAQLAVLICCAGAIASAGTLKGTVRNGTNGQPAAGCDVILIQLQGGMQPVANTKTDAQGHFEFTHADIGAAPMLVRAVYRGVNYHEPVPPGKTTAEVQVFEPTDKAGTFAVAARAVILQPNASDLLVGEEYSIENKTHPPMAYFHQNGSFVFALPDGAQLSQVSAAGSSGMPVVQGTIDKGKGLEAIDFPFRPGESNVRVSYKVPYSANRTKLRISSPYAVERLAVFAPPGVTVTGDGFSPAGQEQGFNAYMRESVPANTAVIVTVSGTAPMVSSAPSGSGGGMPQGAGGDGAQNPSVNSRADSGADAPTATATTIPARLDSLKWILVGGFAAIFALGFVYLLRRPQSVAAGAAGGAVAAAYETAPPSNASKSAPKPAAPAPSTVAADVDREVRGSLDELKDTLFRLELRRQAGTIGEDDYARERQRIDATLRNLVRG
ncbi:MAG: hypothetical protein WB987_13950 [Candidatus Acidiferrales bacterium]